MRSALRHTRSVLSKTAKVQQSQQRLLASLSRFASPLGGGLSSSSLLSSSSPTPTSTFSRCLSVPASCPDNYLDPKYTKYVKLQPHQKLVILGFGAIGSGVLPLLFRHIDMKPEQCIVLSNEYSDKQRAHAQTYGVQLFETKLTRTDYLPYLEKHIKKDDFLINLSVDVSSVALVEYCQRVGALYMDTCNEPWAGGYSDPNLSASQRSNYSIRESALQLKSQLKANGPTALITHGANPGLVSHFVKQALLNIAKDTNTPHSVPKTRAEWALLAEKLGVKTIHIAERDTQASHRIKTDDEFVNTWSIEGYVEEGKQPAELSWGTHEKHWPHDAKTHEHGCGAGIYLNRPGALTNVRTWTPATGSFHGMLITHTEAISIADYFTRKDGDKVAYRPTVHFAYHASNDAWMSMHQVAGKEWIRHDIERLMVDEVATGRDELGVLLCGHAKGAYWFGSDLTIEQTRALVHGNNATSLQVCTGVLTGVVYALENPTLGLVEPEEIDHHRIMEVGTGYLGKVHGAYTDWTPLHRRNLLFPEKIDESDPWQFQNFRVQ